MISLFQHFEADFSQKVSHKILNSGIILKTSPMLYLLVSSSFFVNSLDPDLQNPEFRINPENFHPCKKPGLEPGFVERGFKFTKGGSICSFYLINWYFFLIFRKNLHENEIICH